MKGQMVAVEQASIAKKCNIQFQGKPEGTRVGRRIEVSLVSCEMMGFAKGSTHPTSCKTGPLG